MKKRVLLACIFTVIQLVLLSGCMSVFGTVMNSTHMDKSIPASEHSMVYVSEFLEVTGYDAIRSNPGFLLKEFATTSLRDVVSFLPSGTHTFVMNYFKRRDDLASYDTLVMERSNDIEFAYDFLPGRFYHIYPVASESSVHVVVMDETETTDEHLMKLRDAAMAKLTK